MKTTVLFICLCSAFASYSQSRENRPKLFFAKESRPIMTATGWAYNETLGEWIDYQNFISPDKDYKTKYTTLLTANGYVQSRTDNFLHLLVKSVMIDGRTFYVLLVEKWAGRYEYPSIQEDWYTWKQLDGYLFTAEEYVKMKNATDCKSTLKVSQGASYESIDEQKFLDLLQTEFRRERGYSSDYVFKIEKVNDNGVSLVRFNLPVATLIEQYSKSKAKKYFEVSEAEFNRLSID